MITVSQAIVVEGKYDKIKLESVIDGLIIEVGGFRIYKNKELLDLLRALAKKVGLVLLTDSDAAGFQIRSFLRSAVRDGQIYNVYIPDLYGKERRKAKPSAEGKLGVEGVSVEVIREAFAHAGIACGERQENRRLVTKADLFEDRLTGCPESASRRKALKKCLDLPEHLSTNGLLDVLNTLYSYEEYYALLEKLDE